MKVFEEIESLQSQLKSVMAESNPAVVSKVLEQVSEHAKKVSNKLRGTGPIKPESVLDTAKKIVAGPRQKSYGSPKESFERVAQTWSAILGRKVTANEVVLCMIMLKVCREANNHKLDNYIDIAGYAQVGEMINGR